MMFLRNIFRFSMSTCCHHTDAKFMGSLPWTANLLADSLKAVKKSINFKIHGPTADDVTKDIDLSEKVCLITGANSGIGLEMTRCLLSRRCNVLVACRNKYAASVVAKSIAENSHFPQLYDVNLASLKSVKNCSDQLLNDQNKIDIVILNAGVFGLPWSHTDDGLETTFQVNYLSQFYLLMNIEGILAPDARVVFISSESHRNVDWPFEVQLHPTVESVSLPEDRYTSIRAYNISKLCGVLAMHYLGYRWLHSGKAVFCAHPGSFVRSRLSRNWWLYEALYTCMMPFTKTIEQAASTPLYCATSPDLKGMSAIYYKECERCEESDLARDSQLSFRMYDLTREIIHDRIAASEEVPREAKHVTYEERPKEKEAIDDALISNYSG